MVDFRYRKIRRKDSVKCGFFIDYLSDFMNNMTKCTISRVNSAILFEK